MNKYQELNDRLTKRYNDFPQGWAFSDAQLEQQMEKLGVESKEDIVGTGYGGFVRKSDYEEYQKMCKEIHEEREKAKEDDEYLYQMFYYEMGNCEYQLTGDTEYVLHACGMMLEELKDERIKKIWLKAKRDFINWCDENNAY